MTEKGTAFATTSDEDDATGRAAEVQADAAVAETSLNVLKSKVFGMKRFRDYIYVQKNDFEEANYGK